MDEISDELPVPDGEFLVYKAQIKLGGEELNRFDILVPFPLADLFDPPEITADAESIDADVPHDQAESLRKLFPTDLEEGDHSPDRSEGAGTVLVLEDDPQVRDELKGLLEARGFTAITAHLGEDLCQFFKQEGIHAVVLGTAKAEEWELSLCTRLRDLSRNPQLPIIMSALQWTRTGVLKAVQSGARDIMIKPYEASELLGKLAKYLAAA
jgi:PleD family two-component response regulator